MKVFWTKSAIKSLELINNYYRENVSIALAANILKNIFECTSQLELFPKSGAIEELLNEMEEEFRFLIRGNYKIIYKIQNETIFITDIFDTRQNPENIKVRSK